MNPLDVYNVLEIPTYEQICFLDSCNRYVEAIGHTGWTYNVFGDVFFSQIYGLLIQIHML